MQKEIRETYSPHLYYPDLSFRIEERRSDQKGNRIGFKGYAEIDETNVLGKPIKREWLTFEVGLPSPEPPISMRVINRSSAAQDLLVIRNPHHLTDAVQISRIQVRAEWSHAYEINPGVTRIRILRITDPANVPRPMQQNISGPEVILTPFNGSAEYRIPHDDEWLKSAGAKI